MTEFQVVLSTNSYTMARAPDEAAARILLNFPDHLPEALRDPNRWSATGVTEVARATGTDWAVNRRREYRVTVSTIWHVAAETPEDATAAALAEFLRHFPDLPPDVPVPWRVTEVSVVSAV